jgi:hypothetical protein
VTARDASGEEPVRARAQCLSAWQRALNGLREWVAVIRDINHNPLVEYERTVRHRRLPYVVQRAAAWARRLIPAPASKLPTGLVLPIIAALSLVLIYFSINYIQHKNHAGTHVWLDPQAIEEKLFLVYLVLLTPLAFDCARGALQFLSDHGRRFNTGAVVDESLAVTRLSDKELLAGFVVTRLAPVWRLALWFTLASAVTVLCNCWPMTGADLTLLLTTVVFIISMALGLWLAALIWFLYYLCLARELRSRLACDLLLIFMLLGQLGLWLWMHYDDVPNTLFFSDYQLPLSVHIVFFIALYTLSLMIAKRSPKSSLALAMAMPVIVVLTHLYALSTSGEPLAGMRWHLFSSDSFPFVLSGYSFGYTYVPYVYREVIGVPDSHTWLVPCSLVFLAQLVQVCIVLSFATEAVHARRMRPE